MNKKIRIITDSASDMTAEQLQEYKVQLAPMKLVAGEESLVDDKTIPISALWERMEKGEDIKTSQPSPQAFLELFEAAKENQEAVVCVVVSSALSGTYQSACIAKDMAEYDDIYIVDSLSVTCGEKMLVLQACEWRDQGELSAREIAELLEEKKKKIRLFACVDTLEYLVRGGRLSKTAGNIGTLFQIKPIVCVTQDGVIEVVKKARGNKNALRELCAVIEEEAIDTSSPMIPLYVKDDKNCKRMVEVLGEKMNLPKTTRLQEVGMTIGCHVGPGGYGICYFAV